MKVLVCGGRHYDDEEFVFSFLDQLDKKTPITAVVHGDASGADTLAKRWARSSGIISIAYPADWKRYGRPAGPIRNQQMLDEESPDLVVAFPGGEGTAGMVRISREAGVTVIEAKKEEPVSQRKKFIRLLPVAAAAATTGAESDALAQLKHIVGANQNPTEENDGSFTKEQWTAARDVVRALDTISTNVPKVRSVNQG